MSSKPTTIFSFHHKCYRTKSMRVYVFKTHHNLQFSPQMQQNKINESLCLQNPPQSSVFTTNATEQINEDLCLQNPPRCSVFTTNAKVFKTHHNLQFSPQMLQNHNLQFSSQMLQNIINVSPCLQNPPQSSVFTTNTTEPNR